MATIALNSASAFDREHRFFMGAALVMTLVVFSGFSFQLAMGRSSFRVPIFLHVHALLFFGWTVLYLVQSLLAGSKNIALHRRLGWVAVVWVPAMMVMGTYVTIVSVRTMHAPFFFQPAYFAVMNPLLLYLFGGLVAAAIWMRRRTLWHRRLMLCAMSLLLPPAIGRIAPSPLLIPYTGEVVLAVALLFPLAGMVHDARAHGRIHSAWFWGVGMIVAMQVVGNAITFSPLGPAIYRAVTAGSPGAAQAPLAFPPPP